MIEVFGKYFFQRQKEMWSLAKVQWPAIELLYNLLYKLCFGNVGCTVCFDGRLEAGRDIEVRFNCILNLHFPLTL